MHRCVGQCRKSRNSVLLSILVQSSQSNKHIVSRQQPPGMIQLIPPLPSHGGMRIKGERGLSSGLPHVQRFNQVGEADSTILEEIEWEAVAAVTGLFLLVSHSISAKMKGKVGIYVCNQNRFFIRLRVPFQVCFNLDTRCRWLQGIRFRIHVLHHGRPTRDEVWRVQR